MQSVALLVLSGVLATLVSCAPRHALDGRWHSVKWHRERPNIIYGADKEHELLVVRSDIDRSYIDYCLTKFVRNLERDAPEHAKLLADWEQDLSPEITRAIQETGGGFLIVGNHNLDHMRMDFFSFKNDNYDFVCRSPYPTLYCRVSDKACGDAKGLQSKPRAR